MRRRGPRRPAVLAALCAVLLACLAAPVLARSGVSGPGGDVPTVDDVAVDLTVERSGPETYVQEAVVLVLRVTLARPVAGLEVATPQIQNARAITLVAARWTVDNLGAKRFERRVAVFPQRNGPFAIPPFELKATLTDGQGRRHEVATRTEPLALEVSALPEEGRLRWWLPARSVTVTDAWEPPPDRLQAGEASRRRVVVEAAGVLAEQLPALPPLITPGVVTFANPVRYETVAGPDGPVARATYEWDVRLGVSHPVVLQGITIPWFDTGARQMREAAIPPRRIAYGDAADPGATALGDGSDADEIARRVGLALAGSAAFGIGLVWVLGSFGAVSLGDLRLPGSREERALIAALKGAARRGDPVGTRAALTRLARHDRRDGGRSAKWSEDPSLRARLDALDRQLYGAQNGAQTSAPDLRALVKAVLSTRSTGPRHGADAVRGGPLLPLDGPDIIAPR